jgi:hypothetical protein
LTTAQAVDPLPLYRDFPDHMSKMHPQKEHQYRTPKQNKYYSSFWVIIPEEEETAE